MLSAVVAASAIAQTPSASSSSCPQCEHDESLRALARRTEKVRAEVDRLIKEAARQGSDADTLVIRQLSEALARLKASERALKTMAEREARVYRKAPAVAQGGAFGYTRQSHMPAGYMGVSLSGTTEVKADADELIVLYRDTPIIESVEPGSPAQRAGLESGDVVLAYNGAEVKGRSVSLTKLLKPGAKVVVRVRRNGSTKDIPVIIGSRESQATVVSSRVRARSVDPVTVQPGFEFTFDVEADSVQAGRRRPAPRTPRAEPVILPPLVSGARSALAGAEVQAIDAQLGEYFGTSRGIIVLHVAAGTPAHRAGIRGGDVIVRIGDDQVSRPADLQRALARSTTRVLDIEVLRRKERKDLVLKW